MTREFLQNLKVNEAALPKEVIDAILDENSRDIGAAKANAVKPYADYDAIKEENERLKSDTTAEGKTAKEWKEAHDQAVSDHQKELEGIKFQGILDGAIAKAKGKNTKAITALLDVETLRNSEDQPKAIEAALEALKKESGFLFDEAGAPPLYAPGPGIGKQPPAAPATLADALRERFNKKQ